MSRFQAQTNAVLDAQLEELREHLGLRTNQKADLLREIAGLAAWVLRQSVAGREVVARGTEGDVEHLRNPILARLRAAATARADLREPSGQDEEHALVLSEQEVERLFKILGRGFTPTPALRATLMRLAEAERSLPTLQWTQEQGSS